MACISKITRPVLGGACALALSAAAAAQPFVHAIGEDGADEVLQDFTVYDSGDIAILDTSILVNPSDEFWHLVLADPAGVPARSWYFGDPESLSNGSGIALRDDPIDSHLFLLGEAPVFTLPFPDITVLMRFDPSSSNIIWQWRYPMDTNSRAIGMELDGQSGLVAACITPPTGGFAQPTLLRFDTLSGLPIFHNRYEVFNLPKPPEVHFVDVTPGNVPFQGRGIDPGAVFAVGTIRNASIPEFVGGLSKIVVARFDGFGNPVWFRAYDSPLQDQTSTFFEATSIELDEFGGVNVVAQTFVENLGMAALHLKVSPATGAPVAASVLGVPGTDLLAHHSTFESFFDDRLITAGTLYDPEGAERPVMWTVKRSNLFRDWLWIPEDVFGPGRAAAPQPGGGALLVATASSTPNGAIGGAYDDTLLARTETDGTGLCPRLPDTVEFEPQILSYELQVETIQMPKPNPSQMDVQEGDPRFDQVCLDCPGDLTTTGTAMGDPLFGVPDGETNLADLQYYLTLWQNDLGITPGSPADLTTTGTAMGDPLFGMPDGEVNLSDLQFFLTLWQNGLSICP